LGFLTLEDGLESASSQASGTGAEADLPGAKQKSRSSKELCGLFFHSNLNSLQLLWIRISFFANDVKFIYRVD
jgi:hypothetical protein